jgi:DNA repair ATPase RecN
MDSLAADKWRKSVNEKTFKKHYSNFNRALTDYQLGLQKIERDYRQVNDELDNALRELKNSKSALSECGERFIYKPSASEGSLERQLGLNAATSIKSQFKWPKEDLPEKGTKLKNDGKRRWLVIEDTDQLEQARKDSKRLNAIICVNNFDI